MYTADDARHMTLSFYDHQWLPTKMTNDTINDEAQEHSSGRKNRTEEDTSKADSEYDNDEDSLPSLYQQTEHLETVNLFSNSILRQVNSHVAV
jgi:hypothetical protein